VKAFIIGLLIAPLVIIYATGRLIWTTIEVIRSLGEEFLEGIKENKK
jgi:hypothetical protein